MSDLDTKQPEADTARRIVTIHNEDNGDVLAVPAEPHDRVGDVIKRMYAKLGREHRPGDRLRCESTGKAVFGHEDEPLQAYAQKHCTCLVWVFAGDTGGA